MGGSGGGSNGGTDVSYMNNIHREMLDNLGLGHIGGGNDMMTVLAEALSAGGNPFEDVLPYFGGTHYTVINEHIEKHITFLQSITSDTYINLAADAHANILDDELNSKVIPNFQIGMRNINAVQSSAFVIGEAILQAFRNRDVSKFASDLRVQMHIQRNDLLTSFRTIAMDAERLMLGAHREYVDKKLLIDESKARWRLEAFQYAANLVAAAHGGTAPLTPARPSTGQSVLGGALSGASIGGQVSGSGYGALVGGIIGAVGGYLSSK